MSNSIIGLIVVISVFFISFIFYVIYKKIQKILQNLSSSDKLSSSKLSLARCPSCSGDIENKITEAISRNVKNNYVKIRCTCGTLSTWEVIGSPPVLHSYVRNDSSVKVVK